MPEEIIFDENIKGKVQVESLSELEDYVEHENVKRNATITKITRTIGKIIILFTIGPIFLCLSISMIIEIISTIQGTNEGGVTHMAYVLLNGVIIIIIFLILSFHPNACIGIIPVGLLLYIRAADRKVNCKIWGLKKQRLQFDVRHIMQYFSDKSFSKEELISDDRPDEFVKVYYMAKVCTDTQFSDEYIKVSASVYYDALLNKSATFVLLEYQDKKRNTYSIDSEPKQKKQERCLRHRSIFFSSFSHFLSYYGLQLPQGSYPSAINSSLLPLNSSLFFAFIFLTLLQSGLWNFPVFVLITNSVCSALSVSALSTTAFPSSTQLSPVA